MQQHLSTQGIGSSFLYPFSCIFEREEAFKILGGKGRAGNCPELWDGKTAERIIKILAKGEGL